MRCFVLIVDYLLASYMTKFTQRLVTLKSDEPIPGCSSAVGFAESDKTRMLYIHIPFCRELCKFCTFNRILFDENTALTYYDRLDVELRMYHASGFRFSTIYIGGGTPAVLPDRLCATIKTAKELWELKEVSVETNPSDLSSEVIDQLKDVGVNRLSVGVQTFNGRLLDSVNRIGQYESMELLKSRLSELRGVFDTLNIDLIFGLEGQTQDQVIEDLVTVRDLQVDQVTCYPLMKDAEKMPRYREWAANGAWEKATYKAIRNFLLPDYQPSSAWCFSRTGGMIDEYIVEHPSYAGAGSGAFGYIGDRLISNYFSIPAYMEMMEQGNSPVLLHKKFSRGENTRYHLMMQLFGGRFDIGEIQRNSGAKSRGFLSVMFLLLLLSGSIRRAKTGYVVTDRGAYWTMLLMKYFFQGVSGLRNLCRNIPKSIQIGAVD
jgi:menaquinone C8-methyltransferase